MTGPEHYQEAERLLTVGLPQRGSELDAICTAAAQVHATLALAAAAADALVPSVRFQSWAQVIR